MRNVVRGPASATTGAAAAYAIPAPAWAAVESAPNTRPSIAGGTTCWMRVSLPTRSVLFPAPATAWAAAASPIDPASPVPTVPAAPVANPTASQNRGLRRCASPARASEAQSIPTPYAATVMPYPVAEPRRLCSTRNTSATLSIEANDTNRTVASTSARGAGDRATWRSPAQVCANRPPVPAAAPVVPAAVGGSRPSRVSSSAEAKKETAVTPNAAAGPASPTSRPPRAGPAITCRLNAAPSRALALGSRSAGTSLGTLLLPAGENSVAHSPAAATSGSSSGTGGLAMAITAKITPCVVSHPASRRRWSTRSATAPATGPSSCGSVLASSTKLTAPAPAGIASSTRATRLTPMPVEEIVRLSHR
jgi:hypothetical protein